MIEKFLTQESPAKVMTLLCVSMASLAFLFVVSATNSSFNGSPVRVPEPVNSAQVVSVLDSGAAGYTHFLQQNLFTPVQQSVALTISALGLDQPTQAPVVGRVAGAHIEAPPVQQSQAAPSQPTSESVMSVFSPIYAVLD